MHPKTHDFMRWWPFVACAGFCTVLAGIGRFAQHQLQSVPTAPAQRVAAHILEQAAPLDLAADEELAQQLAPFMPLAGLGAASPGTTESPAKEDAPAAGTEPDPDSAAAARARRAPDWVYPEFERGRDAGGRHNGVAPRRDGATPRSVHVELRDALGAPLQVDSLVVAQRGDDGEFSPSAYRSIHDGSMWTIGCRGLSPGAEVVFDFTATSGSATFAGRARLSHVSRGVDVRLGEIVLRARTTKEQADALVEGLLGELVLPR